MLNLAKLLNHKGYYYITSINTEYNHNRLLRFPKRPALASFRFQTIPDSLLMVSWTLITWMQGRKYLCCVTSSTSKNMLPHFKKLNNDNNSVPSVNCIVADGTLSFGIEAGEELVVPVVVFWPASACGTMGYMHYRQLVDKAFRLRTLKRFSGSPWGGYLNPRPHPRLFVGTRLRLYEGLVGLH
ncbi:hypothetical protein PIB30_073385 [Stylosanthes scabra]|uniref:Uncharacterized protein n=1 Tax=Stylosanthes scabra TaxID=79078 RepID=A0ABU6VPM9_9FABA|nr:hypothetical protein [Stylosanthes scabra]